MKAVVILALSALNFSLARVTFPNSVVLQGPDIFGTNKAAFECLNTCKLYADRKYNNLVITQNGQMIANFNTIATGSTAAATGCELQRGDYTLENRGEVNPKFVLYIVDSKAPNHGSPVYTPLENEGIAVKDTARFVTILSSFDEIRFSKFAGTFPAGYPRIYATGYDTADSCHPVYQARSQRNAETSSPMIPTAVLTVDFGFEGAHSVKVDQHEDDVPMKDVGESAIYTSPGYVGCSFNAGQNYASTITKVEDKYHLEADRLDVSAVYNGLTAAEPLQFSVGKKKESLVGSDSYIASYDKDDFQIQLSWTRATPGSSFALQLDFGSASDPYNKPTTAAAIQSTTSTGSALSALTSLAIVTMLCLRA